MPVAIDDVAEKSPRRPIETNIVRMKKLADYKDLLVPPTCSASLHVTAARTIDVTGARNGAMEGDASKS
jgi:hypothetical protein